MPRRLAMELLALLAPPSCAACSAPLAAAGERVCATCRRELPWLREPLCRRCGLPAPCAPCPASGAAFERAWAPVEYDGTARALVLALKFRRRLSVADVMAAQIAALAPPSLLARATLVPVPLHPSRRRARGFDQAQRIARALAVRTALPLSPCLRRHGSATRQAGAGRAARLAGPQVAVARRVPVPAIALLVDDVHTTGATFEACARALRAAGAGTVRAVAYARTLER